MDGWADRPLRREENTNLRYIPLSRAVREEGNFCCLVVSEPEGRIICSWLVAEPCTCGLALLSLQ